MQITVREVAELVEGKISQGDPERVLTGFDSLDKAAREDLSFYGNPRYQDQYEKTSAGAVITAPIAENAPSEVALVLVENPTAAFDIIVRKYGAPEVPFQLGIHRTAVIGEGAEIDEASVCIGPHAVIGAGARIGAGSWIHPHVVIGDACVIGEDCRVHANVSIREGCRLGDRVIIHSGAVVGADGYGFEFVDGRHKKILQAGIVEVHDDVEIGASTTIDRARFGSTVIGEGTKIDNQVQIAHNVRIGKHCLIVAQTGISGSAIIEDYVTLAAKSGIAGHVRIGTKAIVGGAANVISDLPPDDTYFGYPAKPMREYARVERQKKRIPGLVKRIEALEQELKELRKEADA